MTAQVTSKGDNLACTDKARKHWQDGFQLRGGSTLSLEAMFRLDARATILSGSTIEDAAIVAAQAVVTDYVAPHSVVGGRPASVKKKRFCEADIERLLKERWWDWPVERIKANMPPPNTDSLEGVCGGEEARTLGASRRRAGGNCSVLRCGGQRDAPRSSAMQETITSQLVGPAQINADLAGCFLWSRADD